MRSVRAVWLGTLTALLTGLLAALLTASLTVLAGVGPAAAHDVLAATDPKDGARVPSVPAAVRLTFTADVLALGTVVQVTGPAGRVDQGRPQIDGGVVTQPLRAAGAGAYTVLWRATSSDGHPVSGSLRFTAGTSSASATTSTRTSAAAAPRDDAAGSDGDSGGGGRGPLLAGGVAVLVVVLLGLLVTRRRKAADGPSA